MKIKLLINQTVGIACAIAWLACCGIQSGFAGDPLNPNREPIAALKISPLFCDHAVLQRDKPVPVWGWAVPNDLVRVEFAGQRKTATADPAGKWQVMLEPMPACSEARELLVQSKSQNRETKISDVVVGEVWFASGQSNMHWGFSPTMQVVNNEAELDAARDPLIRQFTVQKKPAAEVNPAPGGEWHSCTRDNLLKNGVNGDSALAYFFARELRKALNVPVGVINASLGGMAIECWTSDSAQRQDPELKTILESREETRLAFVKEMKAYNAALAAWKKAAADVKPAGETAPAEPKQPAHPLRFTTPAHCFNGMVAGVIPYAIRGVVWYQGETNANTVESALLYRKQLPVLIADWRARWGCELPFVWVQLPNLIRGPGWVLVREAQLLSLAIPRTGMVVAIDLGEPNDIHPKNKQEVARRLGLWVLGKVYNQQVPSTCGPLPLTHEVRNQEIVISFLHADGGLKSSDGELKGFMIAGEDRKFVPALARIEGNQVIVSSPNVIHPVAVRYAWESNPVWNLMNGANLPASPFRTDNFDFGHYLPR